MRALAGAPAASGHHGGGSSTFLTGGEIGGGEDTLGAFMYAARNSGKLTLTGGNAGRAMGGRHMR